MMGALTYAVVAATPALAQTPVTHYNCPNGPAAGHYVPANHYWEQDFTAQGTSITGGWLLLGANVGDHDHTARIGIYTGSNRSGALGEVLKQVVGYDGEDFAFPSPIPVSPGQHLYVAVTGVGDFTAYDQFQNGVDGCFIGRVDGFAPSPPDPPSQPADPGPPNGDPAPPNAMPEPDPPPSVPDPPARQRYRVAGATIRVNVRGGPGTNFPVVGSLAPAQEIDIQCQTSGTPVNGSRIWDRLGSGGYVSDWWTSTPIVGGYSPGIPRCDGSADVTPPRRPGAEGKTWTVTANTTVNLRAGPGRNYEGRGRISPGALVRIACQTLGELVSGSRVWDRLADGRFIADVLVNTPRFGTYSPGIPRCDDAPPAPAVGPPPPSLAPPPLPPNGQLPPYGGSDVLKEIELALNFVPVTGVAGVAAKLLIRGGRYLAGAVRTALRVRRVRVSPLTDVKLRLFLKCTATRAGGKLLDEVQHLSGPPDLADAAKFVLVAFPEAVGCGQALFKV